MTRVKAFKSQKVFSKLMIGFGVLLLMVGISAILMFFSDASTKPFSSNWMPFFQGFQGIFFIGLGLYNLRNEKYFIEWNAHQLRFLLPDTKQVETIDFDDIQSVDIKLFEIELQLEDRKRTLDLNTLVDKDLKTIKAKFKKLMQ